MVGVQSRPRKSLCTLDRWDKRKNYFLFAASQLWRLQVWKRGRGTPTWKQANCLGALGPFQIKNDPWGPLYILYFLHFPSSQSKIGLNQLKTLFSGRLSGGRGGGDITRRIRRTHARQRAACNLMKYLSSCVIIISNWTQAINYFANWCHSFREADPVHRIQCSCTFFTPSLWCLVSPWRFVSTSIFILPHLLKERLNSNNKTLTFS